MDVKTITLTFDPTKSTVADIFADDIARAIWCLYRTGHIVNQFFNDEVKVLAEQFKKTPPLTPDDVEHQLWLNAMACGHSNFPGRNVEFSELLFPYLVGKARVEYQVRMQCA